MYICRNTTLLEITCRGSYVLYCSSPWDIDLYVGILMENGLAESVSGTTDACLISLICVVL